VVSFVVSLPSFQLPNNSNGFMSSSILRSFLLNLDALRATESTETTANLWGEGKADPKDALEKHGFAMRKMILSADQAIAHRRRGGRRFGSKKSSGNAKSATASEQK
jgi:hypothetical protein